MVLYRGLSYQVRDAEVHGQGNDGGHQAGPESAREVSDVANEPDGEEDERDAVCRAGLVVLYQLRNLVLLAPGTRGEGAALRRICLADSPTGRSRRRD